jgi:hypothetical protein
MLYWGIFWRRFGELERGEGTPHYLHYPHLGDAS